MRALPRTLHRRSDPGASVLHPSDHQAIDQASSAHTSVVGSTASMLVNWLKPLTGSKIDVADRWEAIASRSGYSWIRLELLT